MATVILDCAERPTPALAKTAKAAAVIIFFG
jgi:hypothetical protein